MELEERIASLHRDRDFRGAATAAIEGYGAELYGFLLATLRHEADAREVFAQTCEDLWVGLQRFEGRCSMRTWLYTLARHAAARLRRSPHQRPGLHVTPSALSAVAERVRTATEQHMRTESKEWLRALRDSLDDEERAILVLRVDRNMPWVDVARVLSSPDASDSEEALARESARLRKRFQSTKEKIRAGAERAGWPDATSADPTSAGRAGGPATD